MTHGGRSPPIVLYFRLPIDCLIELLASWGQIAFLVAQNLRRVSKTKVKYKALRSLGQFGVANLKYISLTFFAGARR